MSGFGASAALAILLGWVVFGLAGLVFSSPVATGIGLVVGAGLAFGLRGGFVVGGMMALLAPFGVMLPALALRHVAVSLGIDLPGFAIWELALFLLLYTGFLATAFGVIPVDLYRLGYAPIPVVVMVLIVCAYGAIVGNWLPPLVAVLGQAFWALRWGSSNWFDYVLHVLMWPAALVALALRLF